MARLSLKYRFTALAVFAALTVSGAPAHAGDFLSSLFGVFSPPPAPPARALSYSAESPAGGADPSKPDTSLRAATAGGSAFCVRTCDGRYFAVPATGGRSRAETCKSFCPASETKVFTGSSIDSAFSDSGKSYSSLPNAFRYRTELVGGCTCNGKDSGGLASIKIENDPTLRKGDLVAEAGGVLAVAGGARREDFASHRVNRARGTTFGRLPVVAAQ